MLSGFPRNDRTGTGCLSLFSKTLEFDLSTSKMPIITGKKMFLNTIYTEFLWFINGETNIARFKKAGVKIWDAWADENGDLGPVYGHQMLNYNSCKVNQLQEVLHSLKFNPDSRRHIISLWNPLQLSEMRLPPCYLYFQFFVNHDKKLDMQVLMRSADLFIGVPYDMGLFAMFLHYVAAQTGYIAAKINLLMVDCHVYINHIKQIELYNSLPIYEFPDTEFVNSKQTELGFAIKNYTHGPVIKAPVAV